MSRPPLTNRVMLSLAVIPPIPPRPSAGGERGHLGPPPRVDENHLGGRSDVIVCQHSPAATVRPTRPFSLQVRWDWICAAVGLGASRHQHDGTPREHRDQGELRFRLLRPHQASSRPQHATSFPDRGIGLRRSGLIRRRMANG